MSRKKHWSSNPGYNQRYWTEVDWKDWEKHGRPKLPIDNRLGFGPDAPRRLDTTPVVQPQHLFNGFDLYAKPQPQYRDRRSATSKSIDKVLEQLGIR